MERDPISRERSHAVLPRPATGGGRAGRLLDSYLGTPQHGGTRRDVERTRPNSMDLIAAEET